MLLRNAWKKRGSLNQIIVLSEESALALGVPPVEHSIVFINIYIYPFHNEADESCALVLTIVFLVLIKIIKYLKQ